jgi:hypothetical protein
MIFFGSRASRIKSGKIKNVTCPHCNNLTSMTFDVFVKYAHIYWIPAFPYGRASVIECDSCSKTYKVYELPDSIKTKYDFEKQGTRTPIQYFSGAIIIGLLISWGIYASFKTSADEADYLKDPAVNDVYSIKAGTPGFFTTMRITEITNDSIYVIVNDYEVDKKSGLRQIDIESNYNDYTEAFTRQEIVKLFEEKDIVGIKRK